MDTTTIDNRWIIFFGGIVATVGGWFMRNLRNDVDELKAKCVTREEMERKFDELRESLTASIVNCGERIENQMIRMHAENREVSERLQERMDSLWDRRRVARDT